MVLSLLQLAGHYHYLVPSPLTTLAPTPLPTPVLPTPTPVQHTPLPPILLPNALWLSAWHSPFTPVSVSVWLAGVGCPSCARPCLIGWGLASRPSPARQERTERRGSGEQRTAQVRKTWRALTSPNHAEYLVLYPSAPCHWRVHGSSPRFSPLTRALRLSPP